MAQYRPRMIKHGYEKTHFFLKKKLIVTLSIAGLGLSITLFTPSASIIGDAQVIDGDTLLVGNQKIRLYGIDAPEIKQPCYYQGRKILCGAEAKRQLQSLIGEGRLVKCMPKDRDRYHRVVAICRVGEVDINAVMVRTGYALAYTAYSQKYVSEQQQAQSDKAGIWVYHFDQPWLWRKKGDQ